MVLSVCIVMAVDALKPKRTGAEPEPFPNINSSVIEATTATPLTENSRSELIHDDSV